MWRHDIYIAIATTVGWSVSFLFHFSFISIVCVRLLDESTLGVVEVGRDRATQAPLGIAGPRALHAGSCFLTRSKNCRKRQNNTKEHSGAEFSLFLQCICQSSPKWPWEWPWRSPDLRIESAFQNAEILENRFDLENDREGHLRSDLKCDNPTRHGQYAYSTSHI